MKTDRQHLPAHRGAAFSLIELIGVLAIIAVLASVLAPNALKSLDRAAVRAEIESLHALGENVKLFVRDTGAPPTSGTWTTSLATYTDLAPSDLARNRRNNPRVFLTDPATSPAPRVMILSSMRAGLNLPTAANINTATRFQQIWDTADGLVPPSSSWSGWNAWGAVADAGDHLVIERVNLVPIYRGALQTFTVALNHNGSSSSASYNLVSTDGTSQGVVNIPAGASVVIPNLRARARINLYRDSGGATLDYSYVVSDSGKTFDFDGTTWTPR